MFWSTVALLIRLRGRLAVRRLSRNATALIGSAFALLALFPAAVAASGLCQQRFAALPAPRDAWLLGSILFAMQALWLLLLLPAVGVALGQDLPTSVLRPFPLRRGQAAIADAFGALIDLPTLLTIPLFVAVARHFGGHAPLNTAVVLLALALFCLQTAALWQFLTQATACLSRRLRGTAAPLLALLLMTACLSSGVPSAFAATASSGENAKVTAPPFPLSFTPSGLVAAAIGAAHQGTAGVGLLHLVATMIVGTGLLAGAHGLRVVAERAGEQPSGSRSYHRSLAPEFASPPLSQIAAVAGAEWRRLTRDTGSHLPLRAPAMLLVICFFGWIAPNLGNDPFLNLRDLLGMGRLLYVLLWQVQLLCNRFGNEAGTARLTFGFPTRRRLLLAGRNLALGALLVPLDGTLIAGSCAAAHAPHLAGLLLAWGVIVLIVMTALGNIASVHRPFPLRRQGERFQGEPERSVAFLYVALGSVTAALLSPIHYLAARTAWWAVTPCAALYLVGIYCISLRVAEQVLARQEQRLARTVDGDQP